MPRLSVPLTDDQHAAIRRKAGALGVPQAEVARRLLLAWARGEVEMPIPEPLFQGGWTDITGKAHLDFYPPSYDKKERDV